MKHLLPAVQRTALRIPWAAVGGCAARAAADGRRPRRAVCPLGAGGGGGSRRGLAGPAGGGLCGAGRSAVYGLSAGAAAYRRGTADLLRQHGAVQYAAVPAAPLPAYGRCVRRRADPAAVSHTAGRTAVGAVHGVVGAAVWRGGAAARSAAGVGGGAGGQAPGLVFAAAGGMRRAGGLDGDGIFTGGGADSGAAAIFRGTRAGARRGGRRCAGGADAGPVRHGRAVSGGGAVRCRIRCRRAAERTKSAGGPRPSAPRVCWRPCCWGRSALWRCCASC